MDIGDDIELIDTGLFPDIDDPEFQEKLLHKQEFYETYQDSFKYDESGTSCDPKEFELTSVQQFVGKIMSPETPYNSLLLYHGVGVGKTCAAITASEAYLEAMPSRSVFIIVPKNIRPNFFRTIFNIKTVKLGIGNEENTAIGCTGSLYLKLANVVYERDLNVIETQVGRVIKKRYTLMGYLSFRNYIRKLVGPGPFESKELKTKKAKALQREFSGRMIIIDEAHNLRDIASIKDDDEENIDTGPVEIETANEGSKLVPHLESVLKLCDGIKLILLSGTPMYNSYREIISILRLLLLNDTKEELTERQIFKRNGDFSEGGEELLSELGSKYVSFMRGENPNQFPIRLKPENVELLDSWPSLDPRGGEIEGDTEDIMNLPLVPCVLRREEFLTHSNEVIDTNGLGIVAITNLVQSGNCAYPARAVEENEGGGGVKFGVEGFNEAFTQKSSKFQAVGSADWLKLENLEEYSPKIAKSIEIANRSEGVVFLYSRFVKSGALTYVLALEANGYTNADPRGNFLVNSPSIGLKCALCRRRKGEHSPTLRHKFTPAKYVLLTGDINLSPSNEKAIALATGSDNKNGEKVKIIIGSQISAEGIDLKYIREIHILDSWLHLNKMEQVIGRGIRYCSHALLKQEKRNCTTYMFVNVNEESDKETIDLYSYRVAYNKSQQIGLVSRILKESAIDCNLNLPAILIDDDREIEIIDSQKKERTVQIMDMPFTPVCDWLRNCEYTCKKEVPRVDLEDIDDTTYDLYNQKWRESRVKNVIRGLFERQTHYREEDFEETLKEMNISDTLIVKILREILGNENFKLMHKNIDGYMIYKNGYYLFQPSKFIDLDIPLALRSATTPLRKESFYPGLFKSHLEGEGESEAEAEGKAEGEGESKEVEEERNEVNINTWKYAVEWINKVMKTNGENTNLSNNFIKSVKDKMEGKDSQYALLLEKINTMLWWVPSVKRIPGGLETFRKIFLDYIWDEWLSEKEQRLLLETLLDDEDIQRAGRENKVESDSRITYRYKSRTGSEFHYICDRSPCVKAVVDYLETNKEKIVVNKETTGADYGFIVAVKGEFVLKSSTPPGGKEKLPKGTACATSSNSQKKIDLLENVGTVLGGLDLKKEIFWLGPRKLITRQLCVLMNLVLRWMDERKISGKRWFYRPVSAAISGHKDG